MSYTLTNKEALLPRAITALLRRPNIKGFCLGYVRDALDTLGLHLPPANLLVNQTGHSTALACYRELAKNPAKYGWRQVNQPAAHPVLLEFFDHCGTTEDGLVCGHIALKQGEMLYASMDYPNTEYFKVRLLGSFIPV